MSVGELLRDCRHKGERLTDVVLQRHPRALSLRHGQVVPAVVKGQAAVIVGLLPRGPLLLEVASSRTGRQDSRQSIYRPLIS